VPADITDGIVNYVTVHSMAKSYLYPSDSKTIYDIGLIIGPSGFQTWGYKGISTSYTEYKHSWTGNPLGGKWTWADINDIEIGIDSITYPVAGGSSATKTLRPSGKHIEGCEGRDEYTCNTIDNWEEVTPFHTQCEAINEVYRTFVGTSVETDVHFIDDVSPTERGETITKVVIWGKFRIDGCASQYMDGDEWQCRLIAKPSGTERYSSYYELLDGIPPESSSNPYGTKLFHYTWTTNPDTLNPWTWENIDDLKAGYECIVKIDATDFDDWEICGSYTRTKCRELWVVLYYTTTVVPEIHTSAAWITVNYSPPDINCSITMPTSLSRTVDENVIPLNFWDGTREVYFDSKNLKTMVLEGYEYASGADDRIVCIRDMGRNGNVVTISGFSNEYYNTTYRIASFGWKLVSKLPLHYKWILELQEIEE